MGHRLRNAEAEAELAVRREATSKQSVARDLEHALTRAVRSEEQTADLRRAVAAFPEELETWRQSLAQNAPPPPSPKLVPRHGLGPTVQAMLRAMMPQEHARRVPCSSATPPRFRRWHACQSPSQVGGFDHRRLYAIKAARCQRVRVRIKLEGDAFDEFADATAPGFSRWARYPHHSPVRFQSHQLTAEWLSYACSSWLRTILTLASVRLRTSRSSISYLGLWLLVLERRA